MMAVLPHLAETVIAVLAVLTFLVICSRTHTKDSPRHDERELQTRRGDAAK